MDREHGVRDGRKRGFRLGRRRFLTGIGAGGLATAGTVFGFATPASALVAYGCCDLCCKASHSLSTCESGTHYVWECTESSGFLYCNCCEHRNPCSNGCDSIHYSSAQCQY